jgi:hypothetical protein
MMMMMLLICSLCPCTLPVLSIYNKNVCTPIYVHPMLKGRCITYAMLWLFILPFHGLFRGTIRLARKHTVDDNELGHICRQGLGHRQPRYTTRLV